MTRLTRLTSLLLLLTFFTPMAHAQQTLASYKDQNRVLLLFAPNGKNPLLQQQLSLLNHHQAEMKERNLVVLEILIDPTPPITPNTLRVTLGPGLSDQEQILARRRFDVAPQAFTVLLVGKDGGEKFRSAHPVPMEKLNSIIDAMPMRQDEMRRKQAGAAQPAPHSSE